MSEIVERLARIEERSKIRDEKINEVADSVRAIDLKLDEIRDAHIANAGAMKAHKFWVGGIAAAVSGSIAILAKVLPFTNGFPR